jgi:2-phosphosulfolactate phosphatase
MDIRILQLIDGARQAKGLAVIIDVFRAFSIACYVFGNGARRIIPVDDLARAYQLKKQHPSFLLMGERNGIKQPGFDYGNSPTEIEHVDFNDQTVIHTTSAGTQGIANAQHAEEIITGSFCNAGAIIGYIRSRGFKQVSLVCMGQAARESSDEDTLCAQLIKDSLEGKTPDFQGIRTYLSGYHTARKFFNPEIAWAPERDFDLCLDLNRFDFVLKVGSAPDGFRSLQKVAVTKLKT